MPTLDEAIKNLTQWHKDLQHDKLPDYHDSLGQSIEALKAWMEGRQKHGWFYFPLLPGETED